MKRTKTRIKGPSVQFFDHQSGIVRKKRPLMQRFAMFVVMPFALLAGTGYVGISMYDTEQVVYLASDSQIESANSEANQTSDQDLMPFQATLDKDLTKVLEQKIDSMPQGAEWAVSVRDLNSPRMANVNADKKMEAASFYKMFMLAPLEKRLSSQYWTSYAGMQSINDCVYAMIQVSDNDCPRILSWYAGRDVIDEHNKTIGFEDTSIKFQDGNTTTAREMNELMYRLQNSMILSDQARRLVFDAMYEQHFREGIPTGCGSECLVANKTGNLDNVKHDAAIVTHGDTKYVVVIMSTGTATWDQVADIAKAVDEAMRN